MTTTGKTSFTADLKEALNADGIYLRPPALDIAVDRTGFKSFGIVPAALRGLVALHHATVSALAQKTRDAESRSDRCAMGDCDCNKGIDSLTRIAEVNDIAGRLAKIEIILVDELAPSIGGLKLGTTPYAIGGDWSLMAPVDVLKKRPIDDLFDMTDDQVFEMIERSSLGDDLLFRSSLDELNRLVGGGRGGSSLKDALRNLGVKVKEHRIAIDARDFIGMTQEEARRHLRSKIPAEIRGAMERSGELDRLARQAVETTKAFFPNGRPGASSRRERDYAGS